MGISQLKKVVKTCLAIKVLVCGVLKKTAEVDRKLLLNATPALLPRRCVSSPGVAGETPWLVLAVPRVPAVVVPSHQLDVLEVLLEGEVPRLAGQTRSSDADLAAVAAPVVGVAVVGLDQLRLGH